VIVNSLEDNVAQNVQVVGDPVWSELQLRVRQDSQEQYREEVAAGKNSKTTVENDSIARG
jgi:hypothetical protein